eukprot:NODE_7917_length_734_cov_61.787234_g7665_i0.p3 GENE.NODE_7917_length_734_cov_61.787234_g7665_i0~~NODE_7917_length_734_cov_61.787234_g7665_i0.p3  ORF type:complete len:121 (-),score=16.62 NODE_7917_length_734_cov_61.787234_g7665_i0:109-471(-)
MAPFYHTPVAMLVDVPALLEIIALTAVSPGTSRASAPRRANQSGGRQSVPAATVATETVTATVTVTAETGPVTATAARTAIVTAAQTGTRTAAVTVTVVIVIVTVLTNIDTACSHAQFKK